MTSEEGGTLDVVPPSRPSRFDWLHASWLLGCSIAGFVALFFLPLDTNLVARFAIAMGIGSAFAIALLRFMNVVRDARLWRACRHLPRTIDFTQDDDGHFVAFVQALDGDVRALELPEGYDPREDEGRLLFDLLELER